MAQKLFIGGLSFNTTSEGLREFFAQSGTVISANVVTDQFSGRSRGFGFVEMETVEEAQKAVRELDGREHSPWVLDARLEPGEGARTRLTMSLHYGGNLGAGLLEKLLRDEIEASKPRLKALAES